MENENKSGKTANYNTPNTDTHAGQSKNAKNNKAESKNEQAAKNEQKGTNCR